VPISFLLVATWISESFFQPQIPDLQNLKKLKVVELKEWCDRVRIGKQGLKNDLVNRLLLARSGGSSDSIKLAHNFSSVSGSQLIVELSSPDKDEECPLTLDPIQNDALDFLSTGVTFLKDCPTIKKMSLPCGHIFGALNITYHFLKNNMQCPCCRAGPRDRLASKCVPAHLRTALSRQIKMLEREEQLEQNREDWNSLFLSAFGPRPQSDDHSDESDDEHNYHHINYHVDDDDDEDDDDDDEENGDLIIVDDDDEDDDEDDEDDEDDNHSEDDSEEDDDSEDESDEDQDLRGILHHQMMIFATGRAMGLF
jgi:hypothetical protein